MYSEKLRAPVFTTAPVLTETCWLIRRYSESLQGFRRLLSSQQIKLYQFDGREACWMLDFVARYENIGADLVDASLMYVAEKENIEEVFTLHRRDFSVYRTSKNRALIIVP